MLTDLSRSQRLAVLDVRHGGSQGSHRGYKITGSCMPEGSQVLISVRILNSSTGRSIPGAAESIEGPRSQVFALAHRLAARFSNRLAYLPAPVWVAEEPHIAATPMRPAPSQPSRLDPGADLRERVPETSVEPAVVQHIEQERYTSLIVDARGLGLERSMSPKLRRKDGMVVWDGANADPDFVIEEGIVSYVDNMRQARDSSRAGSHPLIIDAVGRYEQPFPSDPLVADDDADTIQRVGAHDGFLKKFRVIIVTGR